MPDLRPRIGFRLRYQIAALACLLLLAACQSSPEAPPQPVGDVPALPDSPVFTVDEQAAEIRVLVRRGGPLARFGHNHVLVAPVSGVIHAGDTAASSGFRLAVQVNEFVVDPPAARNAEDEDFSAEISGQARAGTRKNMLGEDVLDAEKHPRILLQSLELRGPIRNPDVHARLTLHGVERDIKFPAAVVMQDDTLTVFAQFTIRQTDFGIAPFSIMGGGLVVQDELAIRARVVAHAQ